MKRSWDNPLLGYVIAYAIVAAICWAFVGPVGLFYAIGFFVFAGTARLFTFLFSGR